MLHCVVIQWIEQNSMSCMINIDEIDINECMKYCHIEFEEDKNGELDHNFIIIEIT